MTPVGPVPSPGVSSPVPTPGVSGPRRLRRLDHVWPDCDGNISYLLTLGVDDRHPVLDNEITFERLVTFLLDSPTRYHWFGYRFVIMPDHIHLIAHQAQEAVTLGHWVKALKAIVGGLGPTVGPVPTPGAPSPVPSPRLQNYTLANAPVGPVPTPGVSSLVPTPGAHEFTRIKRPWRWQPGFHDHKFRTPESESRKWEYICLNPVRAKLVQQPEQWPYAGEILYDEPAGPRVVRGTPPLLRTGMLIDGRETPRKAARPTT